MFDSVSDFKQRDSYKTEPNNQLYFVYPESRPPRLCNSANLPLLNYTSDSSLSDGQLEREKRRCRKKSQKPLLLPPLFFPSPPVSDRDSSPPSHGVSLSSIPLPPAPLLTSSLPPVGVFWDIENCHVPRNKSATNVVQKIRQQFCKNYREAEFIVVCDVKKENAQVIQDLHDAQVCFILYITRV